jgi:23S rRNA (cytidine1920-2'-O)/16S rRNA (cytidine1409-2'-O)-methyltransferase
MIMQKEVRMKERLDVLLVKRNLTESREKAKAVIMAGIVFVDGQREDKAGSTFADTVEIEVKGVTAKYVSRGGFKLEKAVEQYGVILEGKVCMDVGSSTGGFTDCMLQNGANKVYAVDVGTNQLAWKLRQDERVISMEKTNIRYLEPAQIQDVMDFISIDVAFISLTKVLLPVRELLKNQGEIVCLIKPQFEAGREKVGKKGVVREQSVHIEVIERVVAYAISLGFRVLNLDYSPIKGPEGNIEYLLHIRKSEKPLRSEEISDNLADYKEYVDNSALIDLPKSILNIVNMAHDTLNL